MASESASVGTTSRELTTGSHRIHYLAAGPEDGPLVVFVHSITGSWFDFRHQMVALSATGT